MWLFKKKASHDDFIKLKSNVRISFRKHKKDMKILNQKCQFLEKEINKIKPLSKQFSKLQNQFTELLKQFTNTSVNRKEIVNKSNNIKIENKQKNKISENSESAFNDLTELEKKGFMFIARLQNESGGNWIPVGSLTSNLYPDRINRKIKTTTSNILKKLINSELINRERKGNYWFIRLTNKGFEIIKKELNKNQLKSLVNVYAK